ncbi:MAG: glycosyltransferase, partial [Candidatus Adiutrix sp.]|nr:glycosyltransferase [Candidatus Adiutrix sp.]
ADSRVKVVTLSRNRGQHIAISAGLDYAVGDYVAVMDCDLQDPPEELRKLYTHLIDGGYDAVFGVRAHRQDKWLKRFKANCYHAVFRRIAQEAVKTECDHANFSVITRQTAGHYRLFKERNRSYSELVKHLTGNVGFLDVRHDARHSGSSSYSLRRYINAGVAFILGSSNRPLIVSIYCAFISFFIALLFGLRVAYNYFIYGTSVPGWSSLAMLTCFFAGLQMLLLGILGLYIGAVFNESKRRPLYLVSKTQNLMDKEK